MSAKPPAGEALTSMQAETGRRRHNLVNVVLHSADADTTLVHAYLVLTSNTGGNLGMAATGFHTFRLRRTGKEWQLAELFLGTDNAW